MKIAILHSRIRLEEKLLVDAFEKRGVELVQVHVEHETFPLVPEAPALWDGCKAVLERCISHSQAVAAMHILDGWGIPVVNHWKIAETCGDKLTTNVALVAAGVPVPRARVAFGRDAALAAIEDLGYPVVMKPPTGSWGRLLARINDREAAEAVIEHKQVLGTYHHQTFYMQEYVDKPGRDLRTFVVGDDVICAIARHSAHWITNTARGATTSGIQVTDEMREISLAAARAVGGGIVAIDLLERPNGEILVNEVNYTMEFKNSIAPTGVDIPARIVDFVLEVADGRPTYVEPEFMTASPITAVVGGPRA